MNGKFKLVGIALLLGAGVVGVLLLNSFRYGGEPVQANVDPVTDDPGRVSVLVADAAGVDAVPRQSVTDAAEDGEVGAEEIVITNETLSAEALPARVAALTAQLRQEQQQRQRLNTELDALKSTVRALEQKLAAVTEPKDEPAAAAGRVDAMTFVDAGFDYDTAGYIAERWSQQELDMLYLRDQASREGWLDTPRYREAAEALRQGEGSLRNELDDDAYDRFLYAMGRPNRVRVDAVLERSPAQTAGLLPGDHIVRYDGVPIRDGRELRDASTGGEPEQLVVVEIERDGQRIETTIPRGPLGVMLDSVSVEP